MIYIALLLFVLFFRSSARTSDWDKIVKGYKSLSHVAIYEHGMTEAVQAIEWLCESNPGFRTDELFQEIFPTVFYIEFCEHMIALESTKGGNNATMAVGILKQ